MTATVAGIHLGIDTHANRPAGNSCPDGSMYSCSTHGLIYKSNFAGNSWATWATLGAAAVTDATISISDVTTNNASTTAHGWLKKLSNVSTEFMNGQGNWATPAGSASNLQSNRATRTAGDITTTSTTFVDMTSMSITFTTGARRVLLTLTGNCFNSGTNSEQIDFNVDGTRVGGNHGLQSYDQITGSAESHTINLIFLTDVLSAASHTFKAQWLVTAGTGTIRANTDKPLVMSAVELYAA